MDQLIFDSPIGTLRLCASANGIARIELPNQKASNPHAKGSPQNRHLNRAASELERYFKGTLTTFTCQLDLVGTEFQKTVWAALLDIPYGQTASYGEIAQVIGKPQASRAVGGANNRNPIPIIIPCHRVVGSSGELTGYAGEIWRKEWLLKQENAL